MGRGHGGLQRRILDALRERAEFMQPEVWYDAQWLVFGSADARLTSAQSSSFRRAANSLRNSGHIEVARVSDDRERSDLAVRYTGGSAGLRWRLMIRLPLSQEDLAAAIAVHRRARAIRLARANQLRPAVPSEDAWLAWYDALYVESGTTHLDTRELAAAGLWENPS
jgi:hypothetical protein